MIALKTGGMIFCVSFGTAMALICAGIIIQDQQRKRGAIDDMITSQVERMRRGIG